MSTWSIEHLPAAGGASTFASLTVWGIAAGALTLRNWDMDELVLTLSSGTALLADTPWQFRDKLVVWRDGVRVFHGWVTEPARSADPASEAQQIRVSGPWWWLANTPMRDPLGYKDQVITPTTIETANGDVVVQMLTGITWVTPAGDVVWSSWTDQSIYHMQGQIRRALYAALWAGAPIAMGEIGLAGRAPVQSSRNATCAAWLQSAARYEPLGVQWWDYAGETPIFRCSPRSGATAYTLPFTAFEASAGVTLAPLYSQQAHAVRVRYWYSDGTGAELYLDDKAGDNAWPEGPGALVVSAELSTLDEAAQAWWEHIATRLYDALHPLAWAGAVQLTEDGVALPWLRPGRALNIEGGRTEWATMAALVQEVTYTFGTESEDTVALTLGAPDHLGVQDWLELSQLATGSATAGLKTDTGSGSTPGTMGDLNGTNEPIGTPGGSIAVQSRGGTWSYCGYTPYDGVEDSPPLRYRTETPSGTVVRKDYDSMHTTLLATRTDTPIGPRTWVGCIEPTASLWQRVQTAGGYCGAETSGIDEPPSTAAPVLVAHLVRTCTNTCGAIGNGYGCCGNALGNCGIEYCGNATRTLSDPDTPEAAWQRLLSTSPAWTTSPNTAIRTVPATGITGIRRELRYRTEHTTGTGPGAVTSPTLTGLSRWTRYRLAVHLQRRSVDETGSATSDWVDAETVHSPAWVTDIDGVGGIDWQVIEPDTGYETKVATTEVELY